MVLSQEEKVRRKEERRIKKWNETHLILNGIDHKKCSVCEKYLPANNDYFYPNKSNSVDGLNPYCNECTKNRATTWIKENHDTYLESMKKQNIKPENKKKRRESERKRRSKGKLNEWYENNPDKVKRYRDERKHKNHKISDLEWFYCRAYFNDCCAYCGISWEQHFQIHKKDFHKEHFDDEGANDLTNCVPSCTQCNSEKHTFNFLEWFNIDNPKYDETRKKRILQWINQDHKKFIEHKKRR
jgi:hypothetical protein